ncbi:MAG: TIGR03087 family PEP-CTERM/XrtA system glycosyltransferase [Pseudomonadota bacterium]
MKILYICHRFPYPPASGAKIRSFHMIRHLHEQGHEVVLATIYRSDEEREAGAGMEAYCSRMITAQVSKAPAVARMLTRLPTPIPSSMGFFYSPELHKLLREELANQPRPDLIIVHCSSVAHYVEDIDDVPKILDFADMDSQKWLAYASYHGFPRNLGYWLEGSKMERAERRLAPRFELNTCTTPEETATLDGFGTGARADWFVNGVDTEYFSPMAQTDRHQICFVGRMDYYPNAQAMVNFCADIWPALKERYPPLRLAIVGAEPTAAVRKLAALEGVEVTGSVPDVRPWVGRSRLSVAPLTIARGTQNKLLESMAMGVPVVCSAIAARGVDVEAGEHLLVADTPEEYLDQVGLLLESDERHEALSIAGRDRVLSHHTWETAMQRFDELVAQTVARGA